MGGVSSGVGVKAIATRRIGIDARSTPPPAEWAGAGRARASGACHRGPRAVGAEVGRAEMLLDADIGQGQNARDVTTRKLTRAARSRALKRARIRMTPAGRVTPRCLMPGVASFMESATEWHG